MTTNSNDANLAKDPRLRAGPGRQRRLDEATWYDELEAMWGRKWGACDHRQAPHCHAPPKPTSRHFGAERVIHEFERAAQPNAEIILEGEDDHTVGSARILFTPGHTKGAYIRK